MRDKQTQQILTIYFICYLSHYIGRGIMLSISDQCDFETRNRFGDIIIDLSSVIIPRTRLTRLRVSVELVVSSFVMRSRSSLTFSLGERDFDLPKKFILVYPNGWKAVYEYEWPQDLIWEAILKLGERMVGEMRLDELVCLIDVPYTYASAQLYCDDDGDSLLMLCSSMWCMNVSDIIHWPDTDNPLLLITRSDVDFQGIQVHGLRNTSTLLLRRSSPLSCSLSTLHLHPWNTHPRWTTHLRQSPLYPSIVPYLLSRALFENYDQDLKQLITSLKGKLEGDVKQLKGGMYPFFVLCGHGADGQEQRKSALKKVSEELDEAEEIVCLAIREWADE